MLKSKQIFQTFFNFRIFIFLRLVENPLTLFRNDPRTLPRPSRTNPKIFDVFDLLGPTTTTTTSTATAGKLYIYIYIYTYNIRYQIFSSDRCHSIHTAIHTDMHACMQLCVHA